MLQYITLNTSWEELTVGDSVTFHIPNGSSYKYYITNSYSYRYFCYRVNNPNVAIFDILEINAENFVTNVVGYICGGSWPEVKTIDDLKKVIKALDDECIRKWGMQNKNTPQFKVGDKVKVLPRNDSQTYCPIYTDSMLKYAGRLATITDTDEKSCMIDLDDNIYYWPVKALQLITSEMDKTVNPHNLMLTDLPSFTKTETQTETELNLFPEKKHYQLNFNY